MYLPIIIAISNLSSPIITRSVWASVRPLRGAETTTGGYSRTEGATSGGLVRLIRGSSPPAERGGVSRPAQRRRQARRTASAVGRVRGPVGAARLSRGAWAALALLCPLLVAVLRRAVRRRRRPSFVVVRVSGRRCSLGRALRFRSAPVVVGGRCLGGAWRCAPSSSAFFRRCLVVGAAVLGCGCAARLCRRAALNLRALRLLGRPSSLGLLLGARASRPPAPRLASLLWGAPFRGASPSLRALPGPPLSSSLGLLLGARPPQPGSLQGARSATAAHAPRLSRAAPTGPRTRPTADAVRRA